MELGNELHLGLGIPRAWLVSGEPVGITKAPTHFGHISYQLTYSIETQSIQGYVSLPADKQVDTVLHLRLPAGMHVYTLTDGVQCAFVGAAQLIRWNDASGIINIALGVTVNGK